MAEMIRITYYGKKPQGQTVCAMGFFDGVHKGHKKIIRECLSQKKAGLQTVALTFDKHPLKTVAPSRAPLLINTFPQKVDNLLALGVDTVAAVHFNGEVASLLPEDFMWFVLKERLKAASVVAGNNFRFGRDRQGNGETLKKYGQEYGIAVNIIASLRIKGGPVSSTRIRAAVQSGRMEDAAAFLGYPFTIRGSIATGYRIGTKLGYPTANLAASPGQLLPGNGVYLVKSEIEGRTYFGGCNVGVRPTFGIHAVSIEAHFVDWEGNLYGRDMSFAFLSKIRDEMEFESPEALIERLRKDLEAVRAAKEKMSCR
ncbi:MAG: bifunctional riboflavin kinase/FAD synthetase [Abditibacteriota bacterium]|nr:bifunctional riboflavin kinase/FAD synthetase [Abditibacteriota bacterium]